MKDEKVGGGKLFNDRSKEFSDGLAPCSVPPEVN